MENISRTIHRIIGDFERKRVAAASHIETLDAVPGREDDKASRATHVTAQAYCDMILDDLYRLANQVDMKL